MGLIFRAMSRYPRAVAMSIFIKLLATVSELMLPYILEHIIDDVAPLGNLQAAVLWGLLMFGAALLCRQLNVSANRRAIFNAHRVSYDLRQELFRKTVNLSGSQFDAFGLPSLISRMTSDSYNVQTSVQQFQTLCVRAPMLLIGGVGVTLVMDASLAVILLAILPVLILVVFAVTSKGLPMYNRVQQRLDVVVRVMRENITGIRVVKALSKTEYEKRRFAKANQAMTDQDIAASTVMAIPSPLMQLCINGSLSLVVLFGASRVNEGLMEPGVILAFLTYFNMITMGVMGLSRIFMTLSKAAASANRMDEVLQAETDQQILPGSEARTPSGDGFIRFEHVNFSYGEDAPDSTGFVGEKREKALTDISFTLKRGESLGIIGPTGCGKSTIINLLMRFYDPDQGCIYVDGTENRAYTMDSLRRSYAMVLQDTWVFRGTIFDNIAYGKENATMDEVVRAAKAARIHSYIMRLPQGYHTVISEDGGNISKGQKQLLTIARAMLYDTNMLILDEATSNVDTNTERQVQKAIRSLMAGKTCFVIAHRLSTIQNADQILVVDHGDVVEQGTHEELMSRKGFYYQLYASQFG